MAHHSVASIHILIEPIYVPLASDAHTTKIVGHISHFVPLHRQQPVCSHTYLLISKIPRDVPNTPNIPINSAPSTHLLTMHPPRTTSTISAPLRLFVSLRRQQQTYTHPRLFSFKPFDLPHTAPAMSKTAHQPLTPSQCLHPERHQIRQSFRISPLPPAASTKLTCSLTSFCPRPTPYILPPVPATTPLNIALPTDLPTTYAP